MRPARPAAPPAAPGARRRPRSLPPRSGQPAAARAPGPAPGSAPAVGGQAHAASGTDSATRARGRGGLVPSSTTFTRHPVFIGAPAPSGAAKGGTGPPDVGPAAAGQQPTPRHPRRVMAGVRPACQATGLARRVRLFGCSAVRASTPALPAPWKGRGGEATSGPPRGAPTASTTAQAAPQRASCRPAGRARGARPPPGVRRVPNGWVHLGVSARRPNLFIGRQICWRTSAPASLTLAPWQTCGPHRSWI